MYFWFVFFFLFLIFVFSVDPAWKDAASCPKMRQFKQMFACLDIFGNNKFFDGIKGERAHQDNKDIQNKHNNNQMSFKTHVTRQNQKQLTNCYVLNGGRWGPAFQYQLGRAARELKNPKNKDLPNDAMINFVFPTRMSDSRKIQVTKYYGKSHKPCIRVQVKNHQHRSELIQYLNAACHWVDNNRRITWHEINSSKHWKVKKISNFRFHNKDSSFSMILDGSNKCIMKTNNSHVFQFKHAYCFKYLDFDPIFIAFGTFWRIEESSTSNTWLGDKFHSMDSIDIRRRVPGWYFMSNLVEPVFLMHECVRMVDVINTLPKTRKTKKEQQIFYKCFSLHMHKLVVDKRESTNKKQKVELPCGPLYSCVDHDRFSCKQCNTDYLTFSTKKWKLKWKCNTEFNSRYRIFDRKNGLVMTLMRTIQRDAYHQYF